MLSAVANIIGIVTNIIGCVLAILTYHRKKGQTSHTQNNVRVNVNVYNNPPRTTRSPSTTSGIQYLDGESVLFLWLFVFVVSTYVYKNYRYWLMPSIALFILLLTLFVYFYFKSDLSLYTLPRETFLVYLVSVVFTSATIISTAFITRSLYGYDEIFHASQILGIILSTLVLSVLVWRMVSYSRGSAVNLRRLRVAVPATVMMFLLSSGLLDRLAYLFRAKF